MVDELVARASRNWIYRFFYAFAMNKYFSLFINLIIVANTVVLAMDRYPIAASELELLEYINLTFSIIFFVEMVVKLLGLGFRAYFRDKFNTFDCVIVIISTVDIAITYSGLQTEGGGSGAISALRAFRLLRVFKLAKSWKKL